MKDRRAQRWSLVLLPLVCCLLPACQQQMARQPSYRPDEASSFFSDGRANRPLAPNTVARGHLRTDLALFTGKLTRETKDAVHPAAPGANVGQNVPASAPPPYSNDVKEFPFPVTREVLEHGRDRYMIYCVVCHDPLGTGHGKIVERGYTPPPSYHIPRLREAPVGHFFDVMTNGYGSMPDYKQQVPPRDRWAIAAYIRALQLSQHFPEEQLTPPMKEERRKQEEERRKQEDAGGQP